MATNDLKNGDKKQVIPPIFELSEFVQHTAPASSGSKSMNPSHFGSVLKNASSLSSDNGKVLTLGELMEMAKNANFDSLDNEADESNSTNQEETIENASDPHNAEAIPEVSDENPNEKSPIPIQEKDDMNSGDAKNEEDSNIAEQSVIEQEAIGVISNFIDDEYLTINDNYNPDAEEYTEDSDTETEMVDEESDGEIEEADENEVTAADDDGEGNEEDESEAGVSTEESESNETKPNGLLNFVFDILELFIYSLAAVLVLTTFVFRHSIVDGGSMNNTLLDGDHIIISNLFYTPKRGDVIVCEDYSTVLRKPIVKRIIAVEGDVISVSPYGTVTLNGKKLEDEEYVFTDGYKWTEPINNYKIPEGEVFVMGDHRNASTDSREIGTIDVDSILGKAIVRFYPLDQFKFIK